MSVAFAMHMRERQSIRMTPFCLSIYLSLSLRVARQGCRLEGWAGIGSRWSDQRECKQHSRIRVVHGADMLRYGPSLICVDCLHVICNIYYFKVLSTLALVRVT